MTLRSHLSALFLASLAPAFSQVESLKSDPVHWSFLAPSRPALPNGRKLDTTHHPIDAFVAARRSERGLEEAPRAQLQRLLRRLHLDLIGLPPSVDTTREFLADPSPAAYERLVDRLLASPRFGEHWARPWLDLARYADSNGFQADQLRESWAFRDWVIEAMNRDLPFDEFTIEQLAGDLLDEPTLAQRIATGFHRTVTCNVEAGVHPEANRFNQVVDRVNTTATTWLGTTLSCAQCHDHKYDPFSQREYFELFAFFNNTPLEVENPSGKGVRYDFHGPKMELPLTPEQARKKEALERELRAARASYDTAMHVAASKQAQWEAKMREAIASRPEWHPLDIARFESNGDEDFEVLEDGSVLVGGRVPGTATYTVTIHTDLIDITAFRLETLTHPSLPGTGPGRGDVKRPNFILNEFSITAAPSGARDLDNLETVALHDASADYAQKNWPANAAIDGDPKTGWAIGGGFFKDHEVRFTTGQPVGYRRGGTTLTFTLDQNYGRGRTIGRLRLSAFLGEPALLELPKPIERILRLERKNAKQKRRLAKYYRENSAELRRFKRRLTELQ